MRTASFAAALLGTALSWSAPFSVQSQNAASSTDTASIKSFSKFVLH